MSGKAATVLLTLTALLLGLAGGAALAIQQMRAGGIGGVTLGGPWQTGVAVGTADASLRTRAVVALRGLLALPPREARYLNATTDSAGAPLDGRCRYRITGGVIPARWWSLTVYDRAGRLIASPRRAYSVGSAALPRAERWTVTLGPGQQLDTAGRQGVEVTLRAYHPRGSLLAGVAMPGLPVIARLGCP